MGDDQMGGLLFLSHAAPDVDLAEFLEITARRSISGIDVFRTTRPGQIKAGRDWFEVILGNFRRADRFLILLSEFSVTRPWVAFETGAAWLTERSVVPVLSAGLKRSAVPEPFASLQILTLEDPSEASQAFEELGGKLEEPSEFVARATDLAGKGYVQGKLALGWKGIEVGGYLYAYDGPFSKISEAEAVPMPEDLGTIFQQRGFDAVLQIPSRPEPALAQGYRKVWQIDMWGQKRPLLSRKENQQLYVRPKTK